MAFQWHIVHAIHGRLRLRVECPQIFDGLSRVGESFLRDQPGIQEVRLNPGCRSVVLTYNPAVLRADQVIDLVNGLSPEQLKSYQPRSPQQRTEEPSWLSWLPLGLSSAAIALGMLAESAVAPWLLAAAAVPIVARAFEAVTQRGKLSVDVLDAAATAV